MDDDDDDDDDKEEEEEEEEEGDENLEDELVKVVSHLVGREETLCNQQTAAHVISCFAMAGLTWSQPV